MIWKIENLVFEYLKKRGVSPGWFDSPWQSASEDLFEDKMKEYSPAKLFRQVEFKTAFSKFFTDFGTLVRPGRAIAIEIDGPFHHDTLKDFCRDSLILNTKRVQAVYRLQQRDIYRQERLLDALFLLNLREPGLFSENVAEAITGYQRAFSQTTGLPVHRRGVKVAYGDLAMNGVRKFIEFADDNRGITFGRLVELFRKSDLWRVPIRPKIFKGEEQA